ncbi:chemotaxis protein CheW [Methylobacterium adhaesivum]|uniref:Chemotaxis protein CheW n=1 Tax=Methylobacterium adhaesivum TaxID=333297 RepID=A0ABT8BB44_9HYPH|nr:chemotaxis protein CheW [Methylobacterium adhaesivum]MDN3589141.1 chemotaxis protein CheW [Methylobacterium adhaesivum]
MAEPAAHRWTKTLPATTAFLILDVAGVPCALARTAVREVLPLPDLHAPPAAGGPLAGFLDLGGTPVPVIDLARLLGLPARDGAQADDPYRHLVLGAEAAIAFLVDRVDDLVVVPDGAIRPVAEARTLNGCVAAEIALGDRMVHVLDPARLLDAEERQRLEDFTRAVAERRAAFRPPLA